MAGKEIVTDAFIRKSLRNGFQGKDKAMITDVMGLTCLFRKRVDGSYICTFVYRCRNHGKRISKNLGSFPEMSVNEAKQEWLEFKKDVEAGKQLPKKPRRIVLTSTSFGTIWKEWVELKIPDLRETTQISYRHYWNRYLCQLEDVDIKELTPNYVLAFFKPLIDEKKYVIVKKLSEKIVACLDFAVFKQLLTINPLLHMSKYLPKAKTTHFATFSDETLERDMRKLFNDFADAPSYLKVLLFMFFYTLLRKREVINLKLSNIHEDYIVTRTKTLDEFRVPLTKQMRQCIEYMRINKVTDNDYLFEGGTSKGCISVTPIFMALKRRGYQNKFTVHGIRSCGRQWLQTLPEAKESIIEQCLSHVVGNQVVQAYNRGEYFEERRKIMQKWNDFVEECIGQNNSFMFK